MRGKFIVIEGLDGSGKSTQVALLQKALQEKGIQSEYVHFPRTDDSSPYFGPLIGAFLRGELGTLDQVHPNLVALLFAGDRKNAAEEINLKLESGIWMVADRYVLSNIAYQGAKCQSSEESEKLAQWILELEYSYFNIPKPDINLFLSVPPSFSRNNIKQRHTCRDREYLNGVDDIHEIDFSFQDKVAAMYQFMLDHAKFYGISNLDLSMYLAENIPTAHEISLMIQKAIF